MRRKQQEVRDWLTAHGVVFEDPKKLPVLPDERVAELRVIARLENVPGRIFHTLNAMTAEMTKRRDQVRRWRKLRGKQKVKHSEAADKMLRGRTFTTPPTAEEVKAWAGNKGVSDAYGQPADDPRPLQGGLVK